MKGQRSGIGILTLGIFSAALSAAPFTASDEAFARKAALAGMTEIEASRLALAKSTDEKVRTFAQHMVDDHTKAAEQLKAVATQQGVPLPLDLDASHRKAVETLQSLSGAAFDAAYRSQMLADHKDAVALFEGEAKRGTSGLEQFASETLPTLRTHLSMAQELAGASRMNASK